jgi:hypothetical protein
MNFPASSVRPLGVAKNRAIDVKALAQAPMRNSTRKPNKNNSLSSKNNLPSTAG